MYWFESIFTFWFDSCRFIQLVSTHFQFISLLKLLLHFDSVSFNFNLLVRFLSICSTWFNKFSINFISLLKLLLHFDSISLDFHRFIQLDLANSQWFSFHYCNYFSIWYWFEPIFTFWFDSCRLVRLDWIHFQLVWFVDCWLDSIEFRLFELVYCTWNQNGAQDIDFTR